AGLRDADDRLPGLQLLLAQAIVEVALQDEDRRVGLIGVVEPLLRSPEQRDEALVRARGAVRVVARNGTAGEAVRVVPAGMGARVRVHAGDECLVAARRCLR